MCKGFGGVVRHGATVQWPPVSRRGLALSVNFPDLKVFRNFCSKACARSMWGAAVLAQQRGTFSSHLPTAASLQLTGMSPQAQMPPTPTLHLPLSLFHSLCPTPQLPAAEMTPNPKSVCVQPQNANQSPTTRRSHPDPFPKTVVSALPLPSPVHHQFNHDAHVLHAFIGRSPRLPGSRLQSFSFVGHLTHSRSLAFPFSFCDCVERWCGIRNDTPPSTAMAPTPGSGRGLSGHRVARPSPSFRNGMMPGL